MALRIQHPCIHVVATVSSFLYQPCGSSCSWGRLTTVIIVWTLKRPGLGAAKQEIHFDDNVSVNFMLISSWKTCMNILSAPLTDRFPSVDTPQAKKNKKYCVLPMLYAQKISPWFLEAILEAWRLLMGVGR